MLSGDNGILQKATTAKENTDSAQIKERIQLAYHSALTKDITGENGELLKSTLQTELDNEFIGKVATIEDSADKKDRIIKVDNVEVSVKAGKTVSLVDLIIANPEKYYGKKVSNYTAGGKTYRIFYVDKTGKFGISSLGSGINTIYLKADWAGDDFYPWTYSSYTPTSTIVLEKMNSVWWNERGLSQSSWKYSEHEAAYLCDPTTSSSTSNQAWSSCFDEEKASYVIGSPSIEMYIASYNSVQHTTGNYVLDVRYTSGSPNDNCVGYDYVVNGENMNSSSVSGALDDTEYGGMYCNSSGGFLASPYAFDYGLMGVNGWAKALIGGDGQYEDKIAPIVALKSDFQIEIEE